MDDEATRLLREIRDLLAASTTSDAAWRNEMRSSFSRNQRIALVLLIVGVAFAIASLAWDFLNSLYPYATQSEAVSVTVPATLPVALAFAPDEPE